MTPAKPTVGVIGAGSWGTALAILANRAGSKVSMWTRNETVRETILEKRENEAYLPDCFIDPEINITSTLDEIVSADILLLTIPSQSVRTLCISLSDMISAEKPLVICSKGIERGSLALMSEVVGQILPSNPLAVLSGPNFAGEAARGLPTATTLACDDNVLGEQMVYALGGKLFRPYLTDDLIGAQIGGAVKNVIAIACGISLGRGYGENARAAIITRGLNEISRLAKVKGGRQETLSGLSGIGDLMLTCSSLQSRNMSLGYAIGKGEPVKKILPSNTHGLTEGAVTADSVYELSMKLGISMPICAAVYQILKENVTVDEGIAELLERPFSSE